MHKYYSLLVNVLISGILLLGTSCKKEYSYEGGNTPSLASGSLKDSLGNCSNISIKGSYAPGIAFTGNNYITAEADISNTGSYTIYTDTVNGYYFNAAGFATTIGLQAIKINGYGRPLVAIPALFTLHFNESVCFFTILPDSAMFNLAANCGAAIVNGNYKTGVLLDTSNTVNILLNVVSPGPYSIQTPVVNGICFGAKGTFTAAGTYSITLAGTGIPAAEDTTVIPFNIAGTTGCSIIVPVTAEMMDYPLFWKYTVDNSIHQKGILDSGVLSTNVNMNYPSNVVYAMQVYGTGNDPLVKNITFELNIARINHVLSSGSYIPGVTGSMDFIGYMGHFDMTGNLSASDSFPAFTIIVTTYDSATRLVEGTFSGPVIDHFGLTHTITDGAFRTYFKY